MDNHALLREKFIIRGLQGSNQVIAVGNRFRVDLPGHKTPLIIRGHSMHITLQFAAEIIRQIPYIRADINPDNLINWNDTWKKVTTPFEAEHIQGTWIAAYYKGQLIYADGHHHLFFDIIEQCEYKNGHRADKYETSITMAENAFRKMNQQVVIDMESHVGFIQDTGKPEIRLAIILRIPNQRATFVVRMARNKKTLNRDPSDYIGIQMAANFIEAINMAVRTGFMEQGIRSQKIEKRSDGMKQYQANISRLKYLDRIISQIEAQYIVKYRPEKPDFDYIKETAMETVG